MWISGSTLSISQRTLLPEHPRSQLHEQAHELSHDLIQSYGARHATRAALDFARSYAPFEFVSGGDFLRIPVALDSHSRVELPEGYGMKGGAAREALVKTLKIREAREPRDLDVVRRGAHRVPRDEEVARRYMARDFIHGARIELIKDIATHLASRDLTINEVLVVDGHLSASLLCVLDTLGQVLRPSRYRSGSLHRKPTLVGQSLLKMIRLYAEGACAGEGWLLTGIPEEASFSDFDLAVHLNKAFQRGRPVAERFLHTCAVLSLIAVSDDPVRDALRELEHLRHGERGLLPDVPAEEWAALDVP